MTLRYTMMAASSSIAFCSLPLHAQDTATSEIEAQGPDTIVVTAQRRAETAQDVPVSLTALSAEQLEEAGVRDIIDLQKVAPSFFAGSPPQVAGTRLNIRGLGSPGSTDPSVASFIDGIYIARPGALLGTLLDIEQAEVLSGPQGTLFGRNAAVGALTIATADPKFFTEGRLSAEYGTHDRARVQGVINVPLTDTLATRFAGSFDRFDGYGYNRLTDEEVGRQKTASFRGGVRLESGPVEWTVKADYQWIEGDGIAVVTVDESTVTSEAAANFDARTGGRAPLLTGTYDQVIDQQAGGNLTDEHYGLVSHFDLGIGDYTVRLISGYRNWDNRQDELDVLYTAAPIFGRDVSFFAETHSQELQLISPESRPLTYVAGLYYYDEDSGSAGQVNLGGAYCDTLVPPASRPQCNGAIAAGILPAEGAGIWDMDQTANSYAVYGQATYEVSGTHESSEFDRVARDIVFEGHLANCSPLPEGHCAPPRQQTGVEEKDKRGGRPSEPYRGRQGSYRREHHSHQRGSGGQGAYPHGDRCDW